jgi:hypothetical protein
MRSFSVLLTSIVRPDQSSKAWHPPNKNPRSAATGNSFNHDPKAVQAKITRFFSVLLGARPATGTH